MMSPACACARARAFEKEKRSQCLVDKGLDLSPSSSDDCHSFPGASYDHFPEDLSPLDASFSFSFSCSSPPALFLSLSLSEYGSESLAAPNNDAGAGFFSFLAST